MDLAKRLNQELASQQQQTKQTGSLEATRPISPDGEPRSRSFEQRPKNIKGMYNFIYIIISNNYKIVF